MLSFDDVAKRPSMNHRWIRPKFDVSIVVKGIESIREEVTTLIGASANPWKDSRRLAYRKRGIENSVVTHHDPTNRVQWEG